ncbi:MAG: O-antigen ligase family protein [Myroides odoratus]|jgi:hypothetical protein|nr:O-antigen ligase family protein [Myroides odoratus]
MEKSNVQNKIDAAFNILILLIGSTFFIRKLSTILIIVFLVFCVIFKRKLIFSKEAKLLCLVLSSLFWIEVIFLWNSSDLGIALKSLEKYLSLLLLPIFILGNYKDVKFHFIVENYAKIVFVLTAFYLTRFVISEPEKVSIYLSGNLLWEAGYVIADSFGNHAPNVNLHLTFVSSILFYYFIHHYNSRGVIHNILYLLMIIAVSCFVFIINTRVALFLMFLGYLTIIIAYFANSKKRSFKTKMSIVLTFMFLVMSAFMVITKVPYFKEKYTTVTFGHLNKVGKLDEIDHPESNAYNSFALRLSVWKSAYEIMQNHSVLVGVGASDLDPLLYEHYEKTKQHFLYKYKLGIHNQYIESLVKFGLLGLVALLSYIALAGYLSFRLKNVLLLVFFFNMMIANVFDSYLSLFMGIVYSGWFLSLFSAYYLQCRFLKAD